MTTAKDTYNQDILDQVAIFNEIVTYVKSHIITSINSEIDQYFDTPDFIYEYTSKKFIITLKPNSAIYPKVRLLKIDLLNKFDVQIDHINDTIGWLSYLPKLTGNEYKIYMSNSVWGKPDNNFIKLDDVRESLLNRARCKNIRSYEINSMWSSIRTIKLHDYILSPLLQQALNGLQLLNVNSKIQYTPRASLKVTDNIKYVELDVV